MKHTQIDILALQETHIGDNIRETRKHYTLFLSGGDNNGKTIPQGIGIMIRTELFNYIEDIENVNDDLNVSTTS